MRSLLVALAVLVGNGACDVVFGLTTVGPITDAAPDALGCHPQPVHDDFTSTSPCAGWGSPTGQAEVTGGGRLVVTPVPNTQDSQGGCISTTPILFDDIGVFLKVTSIVNTQGSDASHGTYMFFQTSTPFPADGVTLNFGVGNGLLTLTVNGVKTAVPYDPVAMLWWRIRPDPSTGSVAGEASPDGFTWQTIASGAGTLPTSVGVEFNAGEYGAGLASPGTGTFEAFNICP